MKLNIFTPNIFFLIFRSYYINLPCIYLTGAHNSKSLLTSAFKAQWYENMDPTTHVWFKEEHLNFFALKSHSNWFRGHLLTLCTVCFEKEQDITSVVWIPENYDEIIVESSWLNTFYNVFYIEQYSKDATICEEYEKQEYYLVSFKEQCNIKMFQYITIHNLRMIIKW